MALFPFDLSELARRMAEINVAPQQIIQQISPQKKIGDLAQQVAPQPQPQVQMASAQPQQAPQVSQRTQDNAPQQAPKANLGELIAPQVPGAAAPIEPKKQLVAQADDKPGVFDTAINTWKSKVTNPFGLAALAATGKHESGFSAKNLARTWSDPSESGGQGTSGGMFSWRNERLNALQAFAKNAGETGNGSAATQATFYTEERPDVIAKLNNAGSLEEAMATMNADIAFAGYDRPGGEAGARLETARSMLPEVQTRLGGTPPLMLSGIGSPNTPTRGADMLQTQVADSGGGVSAPVPAAVAPTKPQTFADRLATVGQAIDPTAMTPPELPSGNAPLPSQGTFNRDPNSLAMILQMLGGGGGGIPPTLGQLLGGRS